MRTLLAALILVGSSAVLRADTVTLTNGNTLEGVVRYEGNKVIIEMAGGVVVLDKSKVIQVEEKRMPLHDFNDRYAALKKNANASADDYVALARFAEENNIKRHSEDIYKRALSLDTHHEAARKALGYVKQDGGWMTRDDAALARGLVQHEGKWVTPEAKTDIEKLRATAEVEKARAQTERLKIERLERELEVTEGARERSRARDAERAYWDHYFSGAVIVGTWRPYRPGPAPAPVIHSGSGAAGIPGKLINSPGYFGFGSTLNMSPNAGAAYRNATPAR